MIKYKDKWYKSLRSVMFHNENIDKNYIPLTSRVFMINAYFKIEFTKNLDEKTISYLTDFVLDKSIKKGTNKKLLQVMLSTYEDKFTVDKYLKLQSMKKNIYDVEYVMLRNNLTRSEAEIDIAKRKQLTSGSLSTYIKRHGKEEGTKKYKEFCKKSAHTLDTFIAKYGPSIGPSKFQEYLQKNNSASLSYFIKKYGEQEGKKRYELNCKNVGYYSTIEYHIDKYGEEKGIDTYIKLCKSKGRSQEYIIEKYGKDYWKDLCTKRAKTICGESFEFIEAYSVYEKAVRVLTEKQPLHCIPSIKKRSRDWHLDHKVSVYECYTNNVPEYIAASIYNLQIVSAEANGVKGVSSSITAEKLIKEYNENN